jgi:hypothetical protein
MKGGTYMKRYMVLCSLIGLGIGPVWISGCSDKYLDTLMDRTSRSAERKVEQRVNQRINQGINKSINKAEESVVCAATDPECMNKAKEAGKKVVLKDSEDSPVNTHALTHAS